MQLKVSLLTLLRGSAPIIGSPHDSLTQNFLLQFYSLVGIQISWGIWVLQYYITSRDLIVALELIMAAHVSKTKSVAELFTAANNSGQKSDKEAQQVWKDTFSVFAFIRLQFLRLSLFTFC